MLDYIPEGTARGSSHKVWVLWSLGEQLRKLCLRSQARAERRMVGYNRLAPDAT